MEKFNKAETLRQKANVTYEEAKAALEQNDWDLMEAMIHLERTSAAQNGSKQDSSTRDYVKQGEGLLKKAADWVARMISLGNSRQVVMRRKGQKVFEIPVTAVVLLAILISPVFWPVFFISLFLGCCYTIANQEQDARDIEEAKQAAEELNQRHQVNSFEV